MTCALSVDQVPLPYAHSCAPVLVRPHTPLSPHTHLLLVQARPQPLAGVK